MSQPPLVTEGPSAAAQWLDAHVGVADLDCLARQGSVAWTALPSGAVAYKLRYRDAEGRQRVRYLGVNETLARPSHEN